MSGDWVVGIDDEVLRRQGAGLLELGGQEHANASEELELGLLERYTAQEAIHVVDGKVEYFSLALLLLAHLQHPVGHDLPHVGLDLRLDGLEVVVKGRAEEVVFLPVQDVVQDPGVVDQDGISVRPHVSEPNVLYALQVIHGKEIFHCVESQAVKNRSGLKNIVKVFWPKWFFKLSFKCPNLKAKLSRILTKSILSVEYLNGYY